MKPGQTLESNANKFSGWYGKCGYYEPPSRLLDTFQTDQKKGCSLAESSEFRRSFESTGALKKMQQATAPRFEKNNKEKEEVVLPVLAKSLSQTSYVSVKDMNKKLHDFQVDDFRAPFFNKARLRGQEDSIDIADTAHVVLATLGNLSTEYFIDKVTKMAIASAVFRMVSWETFAKGLDIILQVVREETVIGREKMWQPQAPNAADKGLGTGYQLTSNYREYFTRGPPTRKPVIYHPDNNPITKDKTTTIQTNREIKPLHAGSAMSVQHIPGYLGHVPRNLSNPKKKDHSFGQSRPMQNDLLLTQRGLGCIGGYAGHNPIYWTTDSIERSCGEDPRTTQGAAFGPERRML